MLQFRVGRRRRSNRIGGIGAAPAARALTTGWRGKRRRWIAGATVLALGGLWVVVLTLAFGSYGPERQATFLASQAGGDSLATMLDQEAAMRSFEATGQNESANTVLSAAARFASIGSALRADVGSDHVLKASVDLQLSLAAQWQRLARAELATSLANPAKRRTHPLPARDHIVEAFRTANSRFQSELVAERARVQSVARQDGILAALVVTVLVLLAAAGVLRVLGRADSRLRALIDNSLDLITVVDAVGLVRYQSPAIARMLGYEAHAPAGTPVGDLLHPDDAAAMAERLRRVLSQDGVAKSVECRWRHADGSMRWLETVFNNLLGDKKVAGIVLNSRDVTERRSLSDQLRRRAFHDPLTGLANRARLEERLDRALERSNSTLSVLFIDLDDFKTVNDSLGHSAGDEFLREVARRLLECVRTGDTVARMGGDEFAVLLVGLDAVVRAPRIAERMLQTLAVPMVLEAREIIPGASIGIAGGDSIKSAQDILRDADLALYAAKRAGKGQAEIYRPFMHVAALERLELEGDLRLAIERHELVLHYQPLYRLADGALAGYEALVRWQHPTRGLLAPDMFIALAEQTGLIVPLTRWALRTACDQSALWRAQSPHPLEVAVNLSFINLQDHGIIADVTAALEESRIPPGDLVLEITESTVMRGHDTSRQVLRKLKDLGVRLALDDFGTGYSSLSRLSQLPFDSLKIPRPFIERITHSDNNFALAQGIVDLGHRLDLSIVAEGIETQTQLARVRAIGAELGQGFHLAVPAAGSITDPEADRLLRGGVILAPKSPSPTPVSLTLVKAGAKDRTSAAASDDREETAGISSAAS
jgi:diguanylate cyclase (GGDEF)-like protein/PAS domain S-box-containing protein